MSNTIKVLEAQRDKYRQELVKRRSVLIDQFRVKALQAEIKMMRDEIDLIDQFTLTNKE